MATLISLSFLFVKDDLLLPSENEFEVMNLWILTKLIFRSRHRGS